MFNCSRNRNQYESTQEIARFDFKQPLNFEYNSESDNNSHANLECSLNIYPTMSVTPWNSAFKVEESNTRNNAQ